MGEIVEDSRLFLGSCAYIRDCPGGVVGAWCDAGYQAALLRGGSKWTETGRLLAEAEGPRYGLAARVQYGAGLRLPEVTRLRVQEVDLERGTLTVRLGNGGPVVAALCRASKHRITVLPKSMREDLACQVERAREVWKADREAGLAGVHIRGALARKFRRAAETFEWFLPACGDRGERGHALRHFFATHLQEAGTDH